MNMHTSLFSKECGNCRTPRSGFGAIPPPRRLRDRISGLARAFKERFVPVWVLVDMLIGVWVLANIVARYKSLAAPTIRFVTEYLMFFVTRWSI